MSSGPYPPPPSETPPPAFEPQPQGETSTPAAYYAPPSQPAGPPSRPSRSAGPVIAIVVIVVVLVAAIGGYVVGGYAFAQSRINSAQTAYNKVVDHQNSLNDAVNSLGDKLTGANVSSASSGDLQSDKTVIAQVITKSQGAQVQIDSDDAALANADSGLKDNQWLTVLSKSNLDKTSTRIGHARKALADAKAITADYVQIGSFYQSFFDLAIDLDTLGTKAQASDLTGAAAAAEQLKTDASKAITLDKAPGLPPEMDGLLHDIQSLATDFTNLINAAAQRNQTAATAAEKSLEADAAKVEAFDFTKASNEIDGFYKPLIADYNSEVAKANAT